MEKQIDSKNQFEAAKYWADAYLSNKMTSIDAEYLLSQLKDPDLSDARCLVRILKKEVDEFNAKIKAKRKLLSRANSVTSSVFAGIPVPIAKIKKLMEENPEKSAHEIFWILKPK